MEKTQVTNLGEAISVLVQVANLAQSRGILSLDDAVIVKSAMDFIDTLNSAKEHVVEEEGPRG
jgi:hypothetical protein